MLLILLCTIGAAAALLSGVLPVRLGRMITVISGIGSFGLAVALLPEIKNGAVTVGFLRADAISVVFVLATGFVYACASWYSLGHVNRAAPAGYQRRFFLGLNAFGWAMLCAPLVDGLALLWVAIEITTVVSALLVAVDRSRPAAEAAWKYLLIASAGLGIGLFATIIIYQAGTAVYGESYDLTLSQMITAGSRLSPEAARLALVLAVLGYGTKVGLFPVHTWLPDAHTEAPTPVSAMLSGSLLAVSFYAILRYVQITKPELGSGFIDWIMIIFGLTTLAVAAFSMLRQRDVKRLLAYSSIEHMGLLCLGVGFGTPLALAGVLLHVLAHAAAKGNAFFGAGVLMHKFGSKDISRIRGGLDVLPWTAPILLCSVFALCGMPPFGLFRSEFQIVAGGIGARHVVVVGLLLILVVIAFFALGQVVTRALFQPAAPGSAAAGLDRGEPSPSMIVPMVAGLLVLVMLGVHPPAMITDLLGTAVAELGGVR